MVKQIDDLCVTQGGVVKLNVVNGSVKAVVLRPVSDAKLGSTRGQRHAATSPSGAGDRSLNPIDKYFEVAGQTCPGGNAHCKMGPRIRRHQAGSVRDIASTVSEADSGVLGGEGERAAASSTIAEEFQVQRRVVRIDLGGNGPFLRAGGQFETQGYAEVIGPSTGEVVGIPCGCAGGYPASATGPGRIIAKGGGVRCSGTCSFVKTPMPDQRSVHRGGGEQDCRHGENGDDPYNPSFTSWMQSIHEQAPTFRQIARFGGKLHGRRVFMVDNMLETGLRVKPTRCLTAVTNGRIKLGFAPKSICPVGSSRSFLERFSVNQVV